MKYRIITSLTELLLALFITLVIVLSVCFLIAGKTGESTEQTVQATVINKEFIEGYTHFNIMSTGKTTVMIPISVSDSFEVTFKYSDLTLTLDNEELFNSLEIGESINLICITKYRKDGTVKRQYLTT